MDERNNQWGSGIAKNCTAKRHVCRLLVISLSCSSIMPTMVQSMESGIEHETGCETGCVVMEKLKGNQRTGTEPVNTGHPYKRNQIVPWTPPAAASVSVAPAPAPAPAPAIQDDLIQSGLIQDTHSVLSSPIPLSSSCDQALTKGMGSTMPSGETDIALDVLPKSLHHHISTRSSVVELHTRLGVTADKLDEFSKYWEAFAELDETTKKHSIEHKWSIYAISNFFSPFVVQGLNLTLYQKLGSFFSLSHYYPITAKNIPEVLFSYGLTTWGLLFLSIPGYRQTSSGFKQIFYSNGHYLGLSTAENNSWSCKLLRSAVLVSSIGSATIPTAYTHLSAYNQIKHTSNPVVDAAILINSFIGVSAYYSLVYHDVLTHSIQQRLNQQFWKDPYIAGLRTTLSWDVGDAITNFLALSDIEKKDFHHRLFKTAPSITTSTPSSNTPDYSGGGGVENTPGLLFYQDLENLYRIVYFGRQYESVHPNEEEPLIRTGLRYAGQAFSWIFGTVGGVYAYTSTRNMIADYTPTVPDTWSTALSVGVGLAYGVVKKSVSRGIVTKKLTDLYDWYTGYRPQEVDFNGSHQPNSYFMKTINHLGGLTVGSSLIFSVKDTLPSAFQIPGMLVAGIGDGLFWSSILNKWQPVGINKIKEYSYKTECLRGYMGSPDDDVPYMTFQVIEYLTKMGKAIETMPDDLLKTHFGLIQTYMERKADGNGE